MLVMEPEGLKEEASSLTKGKEEEAKAAKNKVVDKEELPVDEEEEEKLLEEEVVEEEEEVEGDVLPDEDLESCVVKEEVSEETAASGTLALIESELLEEEEEIEEEVEEVIEEELKEEDILKEVEEEMLVEVAAGHCLEGSLLDEGNKGDGDKVVSKDEKQKSPSKSSSSAATNKDALELCSEDSADLGDGGGEGADGKIKAESQLKVAGQLSAKGTSVEQSEEKRSGTTAETFSILKVKKEPKEVNEEPVKTALAETTETNVTNDQVSSIVKREQEEETEQSEAKPEEGKGDGDLSNPASDEYEDEGHEDVAEETLGEESHGEKRSMEDSIGGSSEESGDMCCKRRRVEGGTEGSSRHHHRSDGSKDCHLLGTEKESGAGSDESLDSKMERLKKEIHLLGVMAKQKEAEWDEIIKAKKVKEETLLRLKRRRRIAILGREVALNERRRYRRRARTKPDMTSEEEGTDEEWYMQIRGMTSGVHQTAQRMHVMGVGGQPAASGVTPMRHIPVTSSSFLLGMPSSSLSHSTITSSLSSAGSIPSVVPSTFTQRIHRPILPKPPMIPGTPSNRRNMVPNSNQISVGTSMTNSLLPTTLPSNGGMSSGSCNTIDGTQTVNQIIGEGRQGPILDVRSIIADYRSRHPETVPLRGRRNKSLTPVPATATASRDGISGGGGSDGVPTDASTILENVASNMQSTQGILNIASLALGSGSQVRTRGIQSHDNTPDIGYLLLPSGNGCPPGSSLPIRQPQQLARDSSRPSSTESSRSGGQAVPPVSLTSGGLLDNTGNFSFKDVLVQFARMSQSEQQQQMMAVIPGIGGQGIMSTATSLQPPMSTQARQPRHILPSTTTSSVLPGSMVTPARPPPPPYPEVTLLPVLVSGSNENSPLRPTLPTEVSPQRSALPPPAPSLLQMSLSAPTSTPPVPSPPSTSLLHGILTKSASSVGSSVSGGATPRATAFAPTLARLLTAPDKQPSLGPTRPNPPVTTGNSVLGSQAFVSIGELLSTSKAKNEITITPVSGALGQPSILKQPQQQQQQQQQQPCIGRPMKEETPTHMEEEQDDSTDRLVIDESAASEAESRRQNQSARQAAPPAAPEETAVQEEGIADEEVEEEEVAMEEEEEEEGAMEEEEGAMEEEEEEGPVPECQGCHSRAAQFVCAGCGNQWYCSRDCQVSAWDEHSEVCSG